VKRRVGDRLVERVEVGPQSGLLGLHVAARGSSLGLRLNEAGIALGERGDGEIVGGLLGVVVLLGHDARLVQALGSVVVETLLFQVSLGVLDIGFAGLLGRDIGGDIGVGGLDGGL